MVGSIGDELGGIWCTVFFCNTFASAITDTVLLAEDRTIVSNPHIAPFGFVGLDTKMCEIRRDHEVAVSTLK
ncbi:hypothetical protein D3C81_1906150 [compost metagenome]